MKTPEELERLAYINGHTEIAGLLAQVIDQVEPDDDSVRLEAENEDLRDDIDELYKTIDLLNERIDQLIKQRNKP
jgi:uncharacterized protein (UPF0335 family)